MEATKRQSEQATTGAMAQASATPSSLRRGVAPSLAKAFTVTELLIVVGIIVLVLALAVPAFNFITGSKSEETAANQIAAMLSRARTDAIAGLDRYRGLMFYSDGDQVKMVLVRADEQDTDPVWVDLVAADAVALPRGVGIQFVDDAVMAGSTRLDDGYFGFNIRNLTNGSAPLQVGYGGVILFDRRGMIVHRPVAFRARQGTTTIRATQMGSLFYPVALGDVLSAASPYRDIRPVATFKSALGFVLFQSDTFNNLGFTPGDPEYSSQTYQQPEVDEEKWLDTNATPVLINRYSGALVKGE